MSKRVENYSQGTVKEVFRPLTLIELLRWRARCQPCQKAYAFLKDGDVEASSLTYEELDRQARAVAALLQDLGARGERALLLYPPGLEYIAAFIGRLYAGMIAVPAYPPDPSKFSRSLSRLQGIVADAQATIALTTEAILNPDNKDQC
jgi:acyl-CoA synthetase (AMP-forming)/AMP-acid ligase II